MYSFCLPFLDATIRNVYFDGRVSEELICSFIRALCCTTTPWRHKHWEESMGPSWEYISAHLDDSYRTVTQSQHQQTTVWHPPFSTVYFRSFSQFVSSALTSSSTHSKVITLHYPPSCSLHTTHSHLHLIENLSTNLVPPYRWIQNYFWLGHLLYNIRNGDN